MYSAKPRTSSWVNLNRTRMLIHPQANLDSSDAHLPLQRLRRGAPSRQVLLALGVKGPSVTVNTLSIAICLEMRQICQGLPSSPTKCYRVNLFGEAKHQIA
jgi:hypothetical protein